MGQEPPNQQHKNQTDFWRDRQLWIATGLPTSMGRLSAGNSRGEEVSFPSCLMEAFVCMVGKEGWGRGEQEARSAGPLYRGCETMGMEVLPVFPITVVFLTQFLALSRFSVLCSWLSDGYINGTQESIEEFLVICPSYIKLHPWLGGSVSRQQVNNKKEAMCIVHLKVIVGFRGECMLRTRNDKC